ncbi:cellulose synthase/poly-beta-1,6-N-acetylglucosamine synthase-like glycosyltransferase [Krasilnikovia cinnamomea]|uniref:Cellulose synthase/poly-beta-1,6-N-acetylglucosamine synthase-like glycosyltransferase n=1 Tax=Krasilnikovia cinnamomea TaxID=349313 RepID=A0A4Q7ZKM0_9ACTN|nr:glycosyltransferase family 2 protein [Krasilnikovia cinnamomea]RZU51104.1 cellulose synthase/poly-beta-1,6-N-acetylglucosamine synthase-like glycosyltransferase [Krasilnikovia cinnamomea]
MVISTLLLSVPLLLIVYFGFFAVHTYAYSVAAFFKKPIPTVAPRPDARVAVVIVSFNERAVIADTVAACAQLTFPNKTVIVGDDSTDPETIALLRGLATAHGCAGPTPVRYNGNDVELWESDGFVLFHRAENTGFKAGNLKALEGYLHERGFDYMYLLDADWRPQADAVERCLSVIEAAPDIAYVQTTRLYHHGRGEHFQRCLAISEEACYLVDLPGRQRLDHMILFTGCCALFNLRALSRVGGFRAGHLTEDIDLSNRFYLAGFRGVFLEDVTNIGEVPPNYKAFRRQQQRWATGSARTFREYFRPVLRSSLGLVTKLSLLRQNAYYTVALGIELALLWSVLTALVAVAGSALGWAVPAPDEVLRPVGVPLAIGALIALFSGVPPLVVHAIKKREWVNLLYIPAACWIALSVVHTYAIANIKGFRNVAQSWFVTPKTNRQKQNVRVAPARRIRALNVATLVAVVGASVAAGQGGAGPMLLLVLVPYALMWIPSLIIGALTS